MLALFTVVAFGAQAQERRYPEKNFAITPPAGWSTAEPPKGVDLFFSKSDGSAVALVMIDDKNKPSSLNESEIAKFEEGLVAGGGGTCLWGREIEVDGIKSYERLGKLDANGRPATMMLRYVPTRDAAYAVQCLTIGQDASEVPEVRQFLESFRFLTPPAPASEVPPRSAAYRLGYIVGAAMAPLLMIVVAVGLLFLIGRYIWKSTHRSRPASRLRY